MRQDPSDLLTPADAARLLDLTPAAVVAMANRGELRCLRTASGIRLFRRRDVVRLAARRGRTSAPTDKGTR